MSIDCIENLKAGDVVCFSVGKNNCLKGNIDYVGKEIVVVYGILSETEYTIPKSDLLDEDGQPIPKRILKHEQALIDLEKEFADVPNDSIIGEVKQIKELLQDILYLKKEEAKIEAMKR